jgi:hypothetical protein
MAAAVMSTVCTPLMPEDRRSTVDAFTHSSTG